jgi:hypothetical protein
MAITSINALTEPISFMDVAQSTDVKLKTFDEKEFNKKYNKFKADLPKTMGSNSLNSIIKGILSPKKKWQLALYLADQVGLPASKKSTDVFNKLKQGWEKIDEQITVLNKSTDKFKKEKIDNLIEFKNAMKEEVGSVFMDSKTKKAADEFLTAITTKPIADTVEDTVKLTSKVAKDINKQNIPDNVLRYLAFKQGVNIPTGIKANRVMSNKTGLKIQPGHPTRRLSQAEKIRLKKVVTGKAKAAGMEKSYLDYVNKLEKLKEYDPKLPHYDPAIAQKMFSIAHQSLFPTKKGAMSTFKSAKPKGGNYLQVK